MNTKLTSTIYYALFLASHYILPISASCQNASTDRPVVTDAKNEFKTETQTNNTASKTFSLSVSNSRRVQATEKLDLGNFNLFHGNTRQAAQQYETALKINPDLWEAHQGLCNCFVRLRKYNSAIKECHELLRLKPNHKDTLFLLGTLLKNQGRLAESIECLNKARQLGLQTPALYSSLGLAQAQSNQLEDALSNLDRAIILSGKKASADAYLGRGVVFYKQGKLDAALEELDLAIEARGGKFARARNLKADILYIRGRTGEAKQEYLKEIQTEDPEPKCFQALGNILLKEGNYSESQVIFEKGRRRYPKDANIALGLAVALEHQSKLSQALKEYRKAKDLFTAQKLPVTFGKHLQELELLESAPKTPSSTLQ